MPFPRPAERKGHVEAQNSSLGRLGPPRATLFERFWARCGVPRDVLSPLPVKEKAISRLPGNARDSLFLLPVQEKAISGPKKKAQERPFSDDSCRQLWPLAMAFSPSGRGKKAKPATATA